MMRPYLNINLFTSKDQFCVCNLDEYYLYPVLKENKDSKKQMAYALQGFLKYHKKKPYMEPKSNDEILYYTGQAYQKRDLTIYDIKNPHEVDMECHRKHPVSTLFYHAERLLLFKGERR